MLSDGCTAIEEEGNEFQEPFMDDNNNDNEENNDNDINSLNFFNRGKGIIMAMSIGKMKLGCAYLNIKEKSIYIMEEMIETKDYHITNICLEQTRPNLVLLPVHTDPEWIDMIKGFCSVELLLSSSFSLEFSKAKMRNCINYDEQRIGENNEKSFCCAGSILMRKKCSMMTNTDELEIQWTTIKGFMQLDESALKCLQIISQERHPNMHSPVVKECLSLYGIMNKPKSVFGRRLFDINFKRPLCDVNLINQRLGLVEYFIGKPDLCRSIENSFKGLGNIKVILKNIRSFNSYRDFHQIYKFLLCADEMRLSFHVDNDDENENEDESGNANEDESGNGNFPSLLRSIIQLDSELLLSLKNVISHCIDFEASRLEDRIVIKPFVNKSLDELKRSYHDLPDYLSKVVNEIAKEIVASDHISSLNVVYFPQLGYLIAVPLEKGGDSMADAMLISKETNFILQFTTEKIAYFKNDQMKKLDQEPGDIHGEMMDLELEIIENLKSSLFEYQDELMIIVELLAQLDFIVALASFAHRFNLKRPKINEGRSFRIKQSKHLLLDIVNQRQAIPNDCELDSDKAIIITGANSSGKSIFLKQIGQLVFLAHIGSFVPALEAEIGLVDRIFCRMKLNEPSVSCDQSTFQSECMQIKSIINALTCRSFLMIDEFGKGTLAQDGICLFAGLVKYIMTSWGNGDINIDNNNNNHPPRMMAITHFHEIFSLFADNVDYIKWHCTFIDSEENDEQQIIKFHYKIINGKATTSFARHCASRAGINDSIISRAEQLEKLYSSMIPPQDIRYANVNPELERANQLLVRQLLRHELEY